MVDKIRYLALSGGGVKSLAYASAAKVLEEYNVIPQIKGVIGTSSGSLAATLLAIGYTSSEIEEILRNTNFENFKDSPWSYFGMLYRFLYYFGLYETDALLDWVGKLLKDKTGSEKITFGEIYDRYNMELVIIATSITKRVPYYFNYADYPEMEVRHAVRMSMSYPIFFKPVIWNNELMCDGGLTKNYAIGYFIEKYGSDAPFYQTIGFNLLSDGLQPNHRIYYGHDKIENVIDYCGVLVDILLLQIEREYVKKSYWERTVPINTGKISTMEFDLTKEQQDILLRHGYEATKKFMEKISGQSSSFVGKSKEDDFSKASSPTESSLEEIASPETNKSN